MVEYQPRMNGRSKKQGMRKPSKFSDGWNEESQTQRSSFFIDDSLQENFTFRGSQDHQLGAGKRDDDSFMDMQSYCSTPKVGGDQITSPRGLSQ